MKAFQDFAKWWIYRNESGRWDVGAPSLRGQAWPRVVEFDSGAEALAAFANGGAA